MSLDQSPYSVGAEFVLLVRTCVDYLDDGPISHIRVKVLQTHTFTCSQTMKVAIIANSGECEIPSVAFLKLYDRRYLEDRMEEGAPNKWNEQREGNANKIGQKIQPLIQVQRR